MHVIPPSSSSPAYHRSATASALSHIHRNVRARWNGVRFHDEVVNDGLATDPLLGRSTIPQAFATRAAPAAVPLLHRGDDQMGEQRTKGEMREGNSWRVGGARSAPVAGPCANHPSPRGWPPRPANYAETSAAALP